MSVIINWLFGVSPNSDTENWISLKLAFPWSAIFIYLIIVINSVFKSQRVNSSEDQSKNGFKSLRLIHNGFLTIYSLVFGILLLGELFHLNYGFLCNDLNNTSPYLQNLLWTFYLSKFVELGDTFIMILRGTFHQVSFLHVYHHATIIFAWWTALTFYPGADAYLPALINGFGHVLMYSYYFLSTLGYSVWWKRIITQLQITQFCVFMIQGIWSIFNSTCAPEFRPLAPLYTAYVLSFLILFVLFYRKTYIGKDRDLNTRQSGKV